MYKVYRDENHEHICPTPLQKHTIGRNAERILSGKKWRGTLTEEKSQGSCSNTEKAHQGSPGKMKVRKSAIHG